MAIHYILVERITVDGVTHYMNRSQASIIEDLGKVRADHEYVEVDEADIVGIWNTLTKSFDPRPEKLLISKGDFLNLLHDSELEKIISSPIAKVQVFVERLRLHEGRIDLRSQLFTDAIHGMQSAGMLDHADRAAELLNG